MKYIKKFLCLTLVSSILFINNGTTINVSAKNNSEVDNTKTDVINLLLDAGMEIEDINKLPEEKFTELRYSDDVQVETTYLKVIDRNDTSNKINIFSLGKDDSNFIPDTIVVPLSKEQFNKEVSDIQSSKQSSNSIYSTDPSDPNPTYTASGYLKQSILFAKTGTKYRYDVSYIADWVVSSRPYDRGTDVFGFNVKNATKVGSVSTHYRAKAGDYYQTPIYQSLTGSVKTSLDGAATSCTLNLWSTDNYLYMSFDVTADSISQGSMYVVGEYYHQQNNLSFTPTFSVGLNGIDISGSYEMVSSMVFMSPNPSARYYFD